MPTTRRWLRRATARDFHFFENPSLWPHYPYLPLTRQAADGHKRQLGLLFDARGVLGRYGFTCTVFLVNLYLLPATEAEFLALPRCVYDTFAELAEDGWAVD